MQPMNVVSIAGMRRHVHEKQQAEQKKSMSKEMHVLTFKLELKSDAYQETIDALRIDFDSALLTFMDQLVMDSISQSHSHLVNLAYRLDFNNFFSNGR
jgi:hypothetical protein